MGIFNAPIKLFEYTTFSSATSLLAFQAHFAGRAGYSTQVDGIISRIYEKINIAGESPG